MEGSANGIPAPFRASLTSACTRGSFPDQMHTILSSAVRADFGASSASTNGTPQSEHRVTPARYSHLQLGQIIGSEFYMKKLPWSQTRRETIGRPLGGRSTFRNLAYDFPRSGQIF